MARRIDAFRDSGPEKGADGWVTHYTTHWFDLTRGVRLILNWGHDDNDRNKPSGYKGYKVIVLGRELRHRIEFIDEAKGHAFRLARRIANEMQAALDIPGPDGRKREFVPIRQSEAPPIAGEGE